MHNFSGFMQLYWVIMCNQDYWHFSLYSLIFQLWAFHCCIKMSDEDGWWDSSSKFEGKVCILIIVMNPQNVAATSVIHTSIFIVLQLRNDFSNWGLTGLDLISAHLRPRHKNVFILKCIVVSNPVLIHLGSLSVCQHEVQVLRGRQQWLTGLEDWSTLLKLKQPLQRFESGEQAVRLPCSRWNNLAPGKRGSRS